MHLALDSLDSFERGVMIQFCGISSESLIPLPVWRVCQGQGADHR